MNTEEQDSRFYQTTADFRTTDRCGKIYVSYQTKVMNTANYNAAVQAMGGDNINVKMWWNKP
jgi:hypothetical protein